MPFDFVYLLLAHPRFVADPDLMLVSQAFSNRAIAFVRRSPTVLLWVSESVVAFGLAKASGFAACLALDESIGVRRAHSRPVGKIENSPALQRRGPLPQTAPRPVGTAEIHNASPEQCPTSLEVALCCTSPLLQ